MLRAILFASILLLALPAAAQTLPPDIVQLANGGMLRGTIIESVPGDHVTIQLATGEVRQIPAVEYRYAGPYIAPAAPAPAPVPTYVAPPPPRTVHVHVDATSEDLTLQQVTGTATAVVSSGRGFASVQIDQFAPLCTAPCDIDVEPGTYTLGVSLGQGNAQRADHNLFTLDRDTSLELEYESREGLRIAGWTTLIVGGLAGLGIMLGPLLSGSDDYIVPLIAGGVVLVVAELVGLILAFQNDHADIRASYY